jgi:hypothetical protein
MISGFGLPDLLDDARGSPRAAIRDQDNHWCDRMLAKSGTNDPRNLQFIPSTLQLGEE